MRAQLVGIGVSDGPQTAYYIPVGHDRRLNLGQQLPIEIVRATLAEVLADASIPKACHNAKFDMTVMARHGMPLGGVDVDTMVAAWLLEPSGRGIGLKAQALQRFGLEMTPIEEIIGRGRDQVTIDQVPVKRVAPYCCADADVTLRLVEPLTRELAETARTACFTTSRCPDSVLMDMEMHGMVVDRAYLADMSTELARRLQEIEDGIYRLAGRAFNVNSTKQLGEVLSTSWAYGSSAHADGLLHRRRRTGGPGRQAPHHRADPGAPPAEKDQGTYVDALPELVNPATGRVHTWFSQTGTSTGRLSSSDPNLQNIPVRTEIGRRVRGAFVARRATCSWAATIRRWSCACWRT
jgi:DNA polymerase-1